jgi:hypothetical protein
MALRDAFVFLAQGANAAKHRASVSTPQVDPIVVGVANYAEAEVAAWSLVAEGTKAIELCGGFGAAGMARISQVVAGKTAVGVARIDGYPGLGVKSGDEVLVD